MLKPGDMVEVKSQFARSRLHYVYLGNDAYFCIELNTYISPGIFSHSMFIKRKVSK